MATVLEEGPLAAEEAVAHGNTHSAALANRGFSELESTINHYFHNFSVFVPKTHYFAIKCYVRENISIVCVNIY